MLMSTDVQAFTVKTFCEAFGIGRSLAYEEIAAGRLKVRKLGRRTLILRPDAERWAKSLPIPGRPT
jgi:excisionase family DNA binding protein